MSRESSLIPTNLLDWPRVAPLLPEQKLILIALWAAPYLSSAGAGVVPHRPFSSTLGLSPEATKTGLKKLRDAKLIMLDEVEEEIFILDWFRFHKFESPIQKHMLKIDLDKISKNFTNSAIKSTVAEKSATYIITSTKTKTITEEFKTLAKTSSDVVCKKGLAETSSINSEPDGGEREEEEKKSLAPTSPENPQDFSGKILTVEYFKKNKVVGPLPRKAATAPAWEAFSKAFESRHGVPPLRDAVANVAVKKAVDELGVEVTSKVLIHFVKSNDPFVVKNSHSLGIFMQGMNRFYIEWVQAEAKEAKKYMDGVDVVSGQLLD